MYPLSTHDNDGKSSYGGRDDGRGGGLRDVVGYANKPPVVKWPRGAKVAVNLVLNYEEGGENCLLHGDGESEKLLSEIVGAVALGRLLGCFILRYLSLCFHLLGPLQSQFLSLELVTVFVMPIMTIFNSIRFPQWDSVTQTWRPFTTMDRVRDSGVYTISFFGKMSHALSLLWVWLWNGILPRPKPWLKLVGKLQVMDIDGGTIKILKKKWSESTSDGQCRFTKKCWVFVRSECTKENPMSTLEGWWWRKADSCTIQIPMQTIFHIGLWNTAKPPT